LVETIQPSFPTTIVESLRIFDTLIAYKGGATDKIQQEIEESRRFLIEDLLKHLRLEDAAQESIELAQTNLSDTPEEVKESINAIMLQSYLQVQLETNPDQDPLAILEVIQGSPRYKMQTISFPLIDQLKRLGKPEKAKAVLQYIEDNIEVIEEENRERLLETARRKTTQESAPTPPKKSRTLELAIKALREGKCQLAKGLFVMHTNQFPEHPQIRKVNKRLRGLQLHTRNEAKNTARNHSRPAPRTRPNFQTQPIEERVRSIHDLNKLNAIYVNLSGSELGFYREELVLALCEKIVELLENITKTPVKNKWLERLHTLAEKYKELTQDYQSLQYLNSLLTQVGFQPKEPKISIPAPSKPTQHPPVIIRRSRSRRTPKQPDETTPPTG